MKKNFRDKLLTKFATFSSLVFTGEKKHRIWSTDFVDVVGYCTDQFRFEGFDWSCDQ
jgi:hypothetical protein